MLGDCLLEITTFLLYENFSEDVATFGAQISLFFCSHTVESFFDVMV